MTRPGHGSLGSILPAAGWVSFILWSVLPAFEPTSWREALR
jgi:hypothetical protein